MRSSCLLLDGSNQCSSGVAVTRKWQVWGVPLALIQASELIVPDVVIVFKTTSLLNLTRLTG